jgi:membrane protease YdiL (CAAX protease family)
MQQHMALENLVSTNQWPLRLSIVLSAVVIAPLVEEMLFRGFIQSLFRSVLNRPWVAIFCASTFFSVSHANAEHWPALFVLSLGIGYAYEKSGSLWRPIFMHVLFNGIMVFSFLINP